MDYERLISWDNLLAAYQKAAKGKRGHGDTALFEFRLEDNLCQLQAELAAESYKPGGYHSFYIHEPKRRLISAAPFRDRVVHHALCNIIEPLFERGFSPASYANRKGKGTHRALDRAQALARHYPCVLQCDVVQFFPAIDHALLLRELSRKICDSRIMRLCARILESGQGVLPEAYTPAYFPGDDLLSALRPRGLPIGNLTSQFWANVYLNRFDHFVQRELGCAAYVRYVDDFLLFAPEKKILWRWKERVERRLADLRLEIHPGTHPRPVSEGFPFLGFVVFPRRRRLKRRKVIHFRRVLRARVRRFTAGKLTFAQLSASARGWANHARYANTTGLRKAILGGAFKF